ncbi:glucan biosynthesis protein D [Corallococcus sp. H22C18031201]|nr:glucan biosynthesis protein D [Corallococcus sp. H22C18031201]
MLGGCLLVLLACFGGEAATPGGRASGTVAFSAEVVRERARALAARPYREPPVGVPPEYANLSYDAYRDIRYRADQALWRTAGLPFQAQFFHPGLFFPRPVAMNVVEGGRSRPLAFSPSLFTYGPLVKVPPLAKSEGFAGFRLAYPLNRPDVMDELVAFLGASYFRGLGQGNRYGLSARGLAIDTGLPGGEEFPSFREFWLETPAPGEARVVVHALLDGPSVAGAYRFVIHPGERTVMEVEASLFARKAVRQLGVAPLTSMYQFGENDRGAFDDFRPEVHDSDGLAIWMKEGEKLWRPLENPPHLSVASFRADNPRGFGLLQRDQSFTSYEDLEARYELRPSAWVEPVGDWGPGSVRLVEIPTASEMDDNIVAFWVPDAPVVPGTALRFAYRLSWGAAPQGVPTPGSVSATRVAAGSVKGARRFVIDFTRAGSSAEGPVEAVVTASRGQVLHPIAQPHAVTGGWRATFELVPDGDSPVELRCFLKRGSETLTETWSDLWIP